MSRYLVSVSLGLLIAPLISLGRTPQSPAAQEGRHASSRRVLTAGDLTYVGAFRMRPTPTRPGLSATSRVGW
jgi:hypothetical protein